MKIKKSALIILCVVYIKIICLTADLESSPLSQKYRVIKRDLQ